LFFKHTDFPFEQRQDPVLGEINLGDIDFQDPGDLILPAIV
jgi:hypothetical protein